MHPRLKEDASIGTFVYRGRPGETHYYVESGSGREFEVSRRIFRALCRADGRRPLDLCQDVQRRLIDCGILTKSRFVRDGNNSRFILFMVSEKIGRWQPAFAVLNRLLPAAAVLLFALGLAAKAVFPAAAGPGTRMALLWTGYLLSVALHEAGHFIAAAGYGYDVSDVGVLLLGGVIPNGAYVAAEQPEDADLRRGVQFSLAGVEMDMLAAGLCYALSAALPTLSLTLLALARLNLSLLVINLLPITGTDGEHILAQLLGVKDLGKAAKKALLDPDERARLLRAGLPGAACLAGFTLKCIAWPLAAAALALLSLSLSQCA